VSTPSPSRRPHLTAVLREGEQVTSLELFFDLVFVLTLSSVRSVG
jgi:low temperature requirement protein LtrA